MKRLMKEKGKRFLAMFLCLLTAIGILPMEVFAFTPQEGQSVTSYNGDYFVGSDGDYYYSNARHYIVYDSSGNVTLHYTNGGSKRRHYMIQDSSGERRTVYCIESGIAYDDGNTYTSTNGNNSAYFQNLPYTAQYGIMLASVYGWQPGKSVPVSGCNEDDYIYATQCILWEYQQQIRTSPYDMNDNAYGVEGNSFYVTLQGRPAQKCYDWILAQMAQHTTIPSFASSRSSSATTYTLKYNEATGKYSLTLEDTNNTLSDLKFSTSSGITVTRSGNQYTFTSDRMIENAVTITAQKNIPGVGNDMLIWGRVGYQTMMCGAEDPVVFYVKMNTETFGTGRIKKTSEDGKVEGVQFHITGNGTDKTVTTGKDGTVDISLMPGTYTVTESVADRYETQNAQTITIVSGKTATVTFNNKLKRGSLEVVKTSEDNLVEGVTFHLYGTSLSGDAVDAYAVTDSTGKAVFSDVLISGSEPYTLEEVDTAVRYVVPANQTAPVEWNKVTQRSFENILKKFRVQVTKTDAETKRAQGDASLAGAVYGLYQGDKLVASYTTDSSGAFTTDYFICDSNWTLREISPSEGYLLDTTVYEIPAEPGNFTVELNTVSEGVVEQVIKGRIRIVKHIDAELDVEDEPIAPAAEAVDAGIALLSLATASDAQSVSGNDAVAVMAEELEDEAAAETATPSDAQAEATVSDGDADAETESEEDAAAVEETETETDAAQEEAPQAPETEIPEEYLPVEIPEEDIEASGGQGIIEQPEEGAKFQVYLTSAGSYENARESERDLIVTDSDGFAVTKDLPYGRYTVHQIEGKAGQAFVEDFTVFIRSNDETYSYIINNQTQSSFIRVEKHDIETGKIIPAANIGFQVRDLSTGELVTQTVYYPTPVEITTYFTNDEGWLMLPCELPYGNYELIEVETCYGYVLDSTPVPFTVDGTQDVVVVEKQNIAQKGTITVTKTGEVFSTVTSTNKDDTFSVYTPVYEVRNLAGATYEIRAAEDIYTLDGSLRAAKGEVVDTITTGSDGSATSKELYLGKYEIIETQAPEPMVLNPESQLVELTYAGQEVALTETSASFYNERQKVQISLEKLMEQDEAFGIGSNGEQLHVTFGLYAAEDLVAADGSMIPADGLIEIIGVSSDGIAVVEKDLPLGSYYLQERATDAHYLISDEKYPVTFAYAGQEVALVEVQANDGEAIENKLLYGSVSGKKVDENGEALAGAKIGLFSASVTEFTEETAILVTTSDEAGAFQFENVPYGKWVVREIESPEGFVLCTDLFEVNIKSDEQVVEIEITNEFIRGNLHLTKFDADYPENKLSGAVFEVYRDTNGNKELDKEDELLGTMEEVEPGEYVMNDLLYGGVFVKEKTAPDGFYLDEGTYYISIKTDGETYEVENDAGKGFYNQAMRGNLKIVKTSSDGKVEGFSFRITGDNYDQIFKTDSNGEILIENLRVGQYTVTEVEDSVSAGYKRPDPVTVELVPDETLTVRVHNDKVTVDVPKTGDDTNIWLWVGIMALCAAGAGTAFFIGRKKKHYLKLKK
ncbi:MAG: SpaA isopeptide-forming pilin-related protein [Eubacteriales bacterium]|nr:SpaA isopeptide-forming pilin-related protein [Eubacteriales bacterium]